MRKQSIRQPRVLAVAPTVQGIGFIFFVGPWLPIDWGIKWTRRDKNVVGINKVKELVDRYKPDALVFEDHRGAGSRRRERIQRLLDLVGELGAEENLAIYRYSRGAIREVFSPEGAATKYDIARTIARMFPLLAPRLPAERKIWLPEHYNIAIFDAASLALTHFATETMRREPVASRIARIGRNLIGV